MKVIANGCIIVSLSAECLCNADERSDPSMLQLEVQARGTKQMFMLNFADSMKKIKCYFHKKTQVASTIISNIPQKGGFKIVSI